MTVSLVRCLRASAMLVCVACDGPVPVLPIASVGGFAPAGGLLLAPDTGAALRIRVGESATLELGAGLRRSRNIEWSSSVNNVAAVSASGTVRAFAVGTAVITATSGGVLEQQYKIQVVPEQPDAAVTVLSLGPATTATLLPGETRQYTTTAYWSDGESRPIGITYTATGGSITGDGLFTAGQVAGAFAVVAQCVCGLIAERPVEISNVGGQLQKLTISPKEITLPPGAAQQFTVTANWSTGATELPAVRWTATDGSVSSTGSYLAPLADGTYRVIVSHIGGVVQDTAVVTVGDIQGPTGQSGDISIPFFSDGFETGARTNRNGFRWAAPEHVSVSSARAFTGKYALRFDYSGVPSGKDGWSEQRFDMGRYVHEIWIEYMLYVPQNFRHRDDRPNNNKFISLWKDNYGSLHGEWQVLWEYVRGTSDTTSKGRFSSSRWDQPFVDSGGDWPSPSPKNFMPLIGSSGPLKIGQWNHVRLMVKGASGRTAEDGESRLWINDVLVFEYTKGRFWGSDPDPIKGEPNLRNGYLLGWSNSGFDDATTFYVDDIKFYSRNPGWCRC